VSLVKPNWGNSLTARCYRSSTFFGTKSFDEAQELHAFLHNRRRRILAGCKYNRLVEFAVQQQAGQHFPFLFIQQVSSIYHNESQAGYRYPGEGTKAAIEFYPVASKKVTAAASEAGLSASSIPTLLVKGDDKPGLGHAIAQAIAAAGVNMTFFLAQAVGRKFSAVLGFETEADAKTASPLIKKAATKRK
jgi:hypothetical protein